MKLLGLLGGMSYESTAIYYRSLNDGIRARLGGLHSAELVVWNFDFARIADAQHSGNWSALAEILTVTAKTLEVADVQGILICSNTMHKVAEKIQESISIPVLHMVDAIGIHLLEHNCNLVGLLGTKFTMEQTFYSEILEKKYGIETITPEGVEREIIDRVIYKELCCGEIREDSRKYYLDVIDKMISKGAQGVILGCTEIGMLISQKYCVHRLFDSTEIHIAYALDWMTT
jgi:aspartate racemase